MIKEEDLYKLMQENKAPHVRLFDMSKQLLITSDDHKDVDSSIDHLKTIFPMFKGYGRLIVQTCTDNMLARRWQGAFSYTLVFDKAAPAIGTTQQFSPWQMPPGFVSSEVMLAKLESLEKQFSYSKQIDELNRKIAEKDKEDPLKQIEKIAPWAMFAMGKSMDEISKVSTMMRIGNANISSSGNTPTNTLTFVDLDRKPMGEKEKIFEGLVRSIEKKVSIEEMIQLYQAIDQDPTLVQTALQALPLLQKPS